MPLNCCTVHVVLKNEALQSVAYISKLVSSSTQCACTECIPKHTKFVWNSLSVWLQQDLFCQHWLFVYEPVPCAYSEFSENTIRSQKVS